MSGRAGREHVGPARAPGPEAPAARTAPAPGPRLSMRHAWRFAQIPVTPREPVQRAVGHQGPTVGGATVTPRPGPVIQRSMYLANADDLIYKDSNAPANDYAFVRKAAPRTFYILYDNVAAVQAAVAAIATAGRWPNPRARALWFDSMAANAGADPEAASVVAALGQVYEEQGGALAPVNLAGVVVGQIANDVARHGAMYNNVGGGSRLPRAEGVVFYSADLQRAQVENLLDLSPAELAQVRFQRAPAATLEQVATETRATFPSVHTLRVDPGAGPPDIVYASRVRQERSRNARVTCAGLPCADDLSNLTPLQLATVTTSFDALPAATPSSGWVPGTQLVPRDRGAGQLAAMSNWNALGAAAFARAQRGRNTLDLDQGWEWLHVQGAQIGGATVGGNLVAGLYATNSAMIPFESMIARWAQEAPLAFWARFDAAPVAGLPGFASRITLAIRAVGHPSLGTVAFDPLVTFDPIQGQVVDKVAGALIKRQIDRSMRA